MCVPIASWFPSFGAVATPGKLQPREAIQLDGNSKDQRIRLGLLDPFQNPGSHFRVTKVGKLVKLVPVTFMAGPFEVA